MALRLLLRGELAKRTTERRPHQLSILLALEIPCLNRERSVDFSTRTIHAMHIGLGKASDSQSGIVVKSKLVPKSPWKAYALLKRGALKGLSIGCEDVKNQGDRWRAPIVGTQIVGN